MKAIRSFFNENLGEEIIYEIDSMEKAEGCLKDFSICCNRVELHLDEKEIIICNINKDYSFRPSIDEVSMSNKKIHTFYAI